VNTKLLQGAVVGVTPMASSGSPGYLGVFTNSTDLGNSAIFQAPITNNIGVNTTEPAAGFHAVATAAPGAFFDVYNNVLGALPVVYRAARGTPGAPIAVRPDDILGGLAVRGYGATGFSGGQGQMMFRAAEPWTDAAHGTYLQLTTTPLGSASWAERMRITPEGNVGIGTTTPGQPLSVAGTIESTTGGFKFPDGTTQVSATTTSAYTAGAGLSLAGNAFSVLFGGAGAATSAARSDHQHDAAYVSLAGSYSDPTWLTGVAASKISGNLPVAQVAGAATLGANTFAGTQTISGGNLALPATTGGTAGVLTLGGQSFLHAFGGATNTFVGGQAGGGFAATGTANAAFGYQSLFYDTTGISNSAFGYLSLYANTSGSSNAAVGAYSLRLNTTGTYNAAVGSQSLYSNTTGEFNAALGYGSLSGNTTGINNIGIGMQAGFNLTTGNNNIDIGNTGIPAEANTIRIGAAGNQTRTFVAGIRGVTTGSANAISVLIDSNGQLGTASSSRRVKDDIADMDAASSALMTLRPVTFHYKSDQNPSGRTLQYGLIAEEVAEVYPGLVARSADGQIETVMYQFLPPMLLNEVQKQQRTIEALRAQVEAGDAQRRTRDEQIRQLTEQLAALADRLARLETRDRH
jgi:hypothetical protein